MWIQIVNKQRDGIVEIHFSAAAGLLRRASRSRGAPLRGADLRKTRRCAPRFSEVGWSYDPPGPSTEDQVYVCPSRALPSGAPHMRTAVDEYTPSKPNRPRLRSTRRHTRRAAPNVQASGRLSLPPTTPQQPHKQTHTTRSRLASHTALREGGRGRGRPSPCLRRYLPFLICFLCVACLRFALFVIFDRLSKAR